jgi:hypothetical protein
VPTMRLGGIVRGRSGELEFQDAAYRVRAYHAWAYTEDLKTGFRPFPPSLAEETD